MIPSVIRRWRAIPHHSRGTRKLMIFKAKNHQLRFALR